MPDMWMDVDTALSEVPVNKVALIDDTDFKTREEAVAYNATGLELIWHFTTTAGATSATVVTPTTGGVYDWAHQDGGLYTIEIPASGGASINNDTEGFGFFSGKADGVLPWVGPTIGFRAAALNDALIDGGDVLPVNLTEIGGVEQSATDLKDFADAGYDPTAHKVQGVVLVDTTTTNTDMRGTNSALLATSAPANFGDLAITAGTGRVDVAAIEGTTATSQLASSAATGASAALNAYDPPTKAEMDSAFTQIKGGGWSSTDTLEALATRLTSARAGYLDNLNVGGNVASSAEVTAIQNNTRVVRSVPVVIERPDSGTATYRIELLSYDATGNMEAPDSAPTVDLVDQGGTDLSSRLDSATGTLVSTGRYRWIYTASATDDLEQLNWTFSVVEGSATRLYTNTTLIVDTTAVDFTSADRTKLDAILTDTDSTLPGFLASILGDTNELQTDWANGGRLDLLIDGIKAVTDEIPDSGAMTSIAQEATVDALSFSTFDVSSDTVITASIYTARVDLTIDGANSQDEYTVQWLKNGAPVAVTGTPQIQVVKRADGTDLVAATNMTQIGSVNGAYKYDEGTNRITAGEAVLITCTATIDAVTRTWTVPLARDSS